MAEQPSTRVLPHELPASLREAGLDNWIREPLDDAVDRRRRLIMPPAVSVLGTPARGHQGPLLAEAKHPDTLFMMGDNPELPPMPERPALRDFYLLRFDPIPRTHLLQSARVARENGLDEKVIMACLLHDIAIAGLVSANHGYWGAQLVAPYVDEEIAWAIEKHEALRYYPDEAAGYSYPEAYIDYFGPDYRPPAYIQREAAAARQHRWYMPSRLVTIEDVPELPLPAADWVRVRTTFSGLCGSDVKQILLNGSRANPLTALVSFPHVLGHEVVGRRIDTGERVVLNPWLSCVPRGINPL